jgi:hypothetical protein
MTGANSNALIDFAAEIGTTDWVAVEGSRTRWLVGGEVRDGTRFVRAPSGVIDHQPEEMTVRVGAGTPVEELEGVIGVEGQRTALPMRGGTVGGALAIGQNHLSVLGRGQVRHSVLQIRYVSSEGTIVTCGGPTVKNVSGFDLPRLLVGSLGTLALIAEVVLRTNPIPAMSAWLTSTDAEPFSVRNILHHPSAVLWDGARTWIELEGHPADVEAEMAALRAFGTWEPADAQPAEPPNRWSLRPSDLRYLDRDLTGEFLASIGVGVVFAAKPQRRQPPLPNVQEVCQRVKSEFDPNCRLNPGRDPAVAT